MVVVAGIFLLAISVFAIAKPLFQRSVLSSQSPDGLSHEGAGWARRPTPTEEVAELVARRDTIYATLKELDMDYEMGKLTLADYQALRDRYRAQAVAILQELDAT